MALQVLFQVVLALSVFLTNASAQYPDIAPQSSNFVTTSNPVTSSGLAPDVLDTFSSGFPSDGFDSLAPFTTTGYHRGPSMAPYYATSEETPAPTKVTTVNAPPPSTRGGKHPPGVGRHPPKNGRRVGRHPPGANGRRVGRHSTDANGRKKGGHPKGVGHHSPGVGGHKYPK